MFINKVKWNKMKWNAIQYNPMYLLKWTTGNYSIIRILDTTKRKKQWVRKGNNNLEKRNNRTVRQGQSCWKRDDTTEKKKQWVRKENKK
jgi:hypothetical protein